MSKHKKMPAQRGKPLHGPASRTTHETIAQPIIAQSEGNAMASLPPLPPGPVLGTYRDPTGRFPAMPVYDMPEETPEAWNAKAARINKGRRLE